MPKGVPFAPLVALVTDCEWLSQAANIGSIPIFSSIFTKYAMRVSHLLESTDYSTLAKIWKGDNLKWVLDALNDGDDEAVMLGSIMTKAMAKAEASPEKIFSFVKPMIDAVFQRADQRGRPEVISFLNVLVDYVLKMDPKVLTLLMSKIELDQLTKRIDDKLAVKLRLAVWKVTRTKDQKKFDADNQLYVFVGRPTFKEEPKGSDNFKKTLEIERLIPVDRFDEKAHQMVAMMKLRATAQGENSEVYMVELPKTALSNPNSIPDWMIPLIDQHKKRISG